MKRSNSPFFGEGGYLLFAVATNMPLFPAFPAGPVFDVDRRVGAFELFVLLTAVWAFARGLGAAPSTVATAIARIALVARIATIPFDICDEVVSGHGLDVWLLLVFVRPIRR